MTVQIMKRRLFDLMSSTWLSDLLVQSVCSWQNILTRPRRLTVWSGQSKAIDYSLALGQSSRQLYEDTLLVYSEVRYH